MKSRSIFVFTHDSIGLGEDGPTHQSIEHVSSLRLIPNLQTWRPADTVETAVAWTHSIAHNGPSTLIFSRQNLQFSPRNDIQIANIAKGGYVLRDWNDDIPARKIIELMGVKEEGATTEKTGFFKVSTVGKLTRSLDPEAFLAIRDQIPDTISPVEFAPKLNLKKLHALEQANPDVYRLMASCITTKAAKAAVKVELLNS